MKIQMAIAAIAAGMGMSSASIAAGPQSGVINFSGQVVDTTCVVNANSTNMNVELPAIDRSLLTAPSSSAGLTPFSISVTGCSPAPGANTVSAMFVADGNIDAAGNLVNTGTAENVAIQLLDKDQTPINIQNDPWSAQMDRGESAADGSVTLKYWARYYSQAGGASAGDVASMANFQLVYE
jgi:major type 1 subunit fimbrin (pilin)